MSIELQVAVLGIVIAVVIGAWQIYLAWKQTLVSKGGAAQNRSAPMNPEQSTDSSENLLHRLWSSFDSDLQDTLSLAYNQAKREGKTRISTRTFFAAVVRLKPGEVSQFLGRLPEESLPSPISEGVSRESSILREEPQLSTCVENSLSHLGKKADPQHRLSTAEVFVDVAKHGTGSSVAQLREQGMTPEKIDRIVKELGWEVRER